MNVENNESVFSDLQYTQDTTNEEVMSLWYSSLEVMGNDGQISIPHLLVNDGAYTYPNVEIMNVSNVFQYRNKPPLSLAVSISLKDYKITFYTTNENMILLYNILVDWKGTFRDKLILKSKMAEVFSENEVLMKLVDDMIRVRDL